MAGLIKSYLLLDIKNESSSLPWLTCLRCLVVKFINKNKTRTVIRERNVGFLSPVQQNFMNTWIWICEVINPILIQSSWVQRSADESQNTNWLSGWKERGFTHMLAEIETEWMVLHSFFFLWKMFRINVCAVCDDGPGSNIYSIRAVNERKTSAVSPTNHGKQRTCST